MIPGPITGVTICTADLAASHRCYTEHLGYRSIGSGRISPQLAALWHCPGMAGARYTLLASAAGDDFRFRFIEHRLASHHVAFATHGWNAAELIVRDVDTLAGRLESSSFEVFGAPANLSFTDDIRAMQIRGPAGEVLYLTQITAPVAGLDTPVARCTVDRAFIVILGGASLESIQAAYEDTFDLPRTPVVKATVKGMSAALGLPAETHYPISALPLRGQSFIEADEMPRSAVSREAPPGMLPAGIAMVSCRIRTPGDGSIPLTAIDDPACGGPCRMACYRGPAGELMELILPGSG